MIFMDALNIKTNILVWLDTWWVYYSIIVLYEVYYLGMELMGGAMAILDLGGFFMLTGIS